MGRRLERQLRPAQQTIARASDTVVFAGAAKVWIEPEAAVAVDGTLDRYAPNTAENHEETALRCSIRKAVKNSKHSACPAPATIMGPAAVPAQSPIHPANAGKAADPTKYHMK